MRINPIFRPQCILCHELLRVCNHSKSKNRRLNFKGSQWTINNIFIIYGFIEFCCQPCICIVRTNFTELQDLHIDLIFGICMTFCWISVFFYLTLIRVIHRITSFLQCNDATSVLGRNVAFIFNLSQCLQHNAHSDSLTEQQCNNSPSRKDMNLLLIVLCIPPYWFLSHQRWRDSGICHEMIGETCQPDTSPWGKPLLKT